MSSDAATRRGSLRRVETLRIQRSWIALIGCLLTVAGSAAGDGPLEITFLGNEGFLLRAGDRSVLIDAISGDGLTGYVALPAEPRQRLEAAQPPFGQADLVLATHVHGDHLDAGAVSRYLAAAPRAQFVSTEQSIARIREHAAALDSIEPRLHGYNPEPGQRVRLELGGIALQLLYLIHGETQNLGFLFELGGLKVLHVGDTDGGAETFAPYDLPADEIDLALIPFWLLLSDDGRAAVRDRIAAGRVVAMHVPDQRAPPRYFGESGTLRQLYVDLEKAWPGIILMREPMESRRFP